MEVILIKITITSPMSARIERHAKVGGPKRLVNTWEVDTHMIEWFCSVMGWFDSQISHPAQPIVHPLDSPVSIFMEQKIVSSDECVESSSTRRNIGIIHQVLHQLFCHVHSSHLSSPTSNQHGVCHDSRTDSSVSLHLLEQVHCTIHVLQLDPALHNCGISTNARQQS